MVVHLKRVAKISFWTMLTAPARVEHIKEMHAEHHETTRKGAKKWVQGTAVKVDVTRQILSLFLVPDQARSSAVKSRVESWQSQATRSTSNFNALTSMVLHSVARV